MQVATQQWTRTPVALNPLITWMTLSAVACRPMELWAVIGTGTVWIQSSARRLNRISHPAAPNVRTFLIDGPQATFLNGSRCHPSDSVSGSFINGVVKCFLKRNIKQTLLTVLECSPGVWTLGLLGGIIYGPALCLVSGLCTGAWRKLNDARNERHSMDAWPSLWIIEGQCCDLSSCPSIILKIRLWICQLSESSSCPMMLMAV